MWSEVVFHMLVSESVDTSHFETSSWIRMLIFICRGCHTSQCLHSLFMIPVSVAGNEPAPHGPCRCATAAPPTRCTRAKGLNIWAAGPPTGYHCKWPRHSRCQACSVLRRARASGMPICSTPLCLPVHLFDEMHRIS